MGSMQRSACLKTGLVGLAAAFVLAGCASDGAATRSGLPQQGAISAFLPERPSPARPLALRLESERADLGPALAGGALYRTLALRLQGDGLSPEETLALAVAAGGGGGAVDADAPVLLSLQARVENRPLPELPIALLAPDSDGAARVFSRWSYRLPASRDDHRLEVELLARPALVDLTAARRAADATARMSGMTAPEGAAGPRWMLAPISDAAAAQLQEAAEAALGQAFAPPAALTPPTAPARDTAGMAMHLGQPPAPGVTLRMSQDIARSRLEEPSALAAMAARADVAAPALGFAPPAGAAVLGTARYLTAAAPEPGEIALARYLQSRAAERFPAAADAYATLSSRASTPSPAILDRHCLALSEFLRDDAALTPVDRVAATIETLREGGREQALFTSELCLPAADRPIACDAGLLNCGSALAPLDERDAMKRLTDYMRWPTRARRSALAELLPDRLTISNPALATGGDAGAEGISGRARLTRDEALALLATVRLNRYGEAVRNPNGSDWWVANFTRRPALRQILTVYAAFENGLFDDIGFVEARVSDADLADQASWAFQQLGPLMTPCDRTESPAFGDGLVMTARRPIGDCAQFDDFALNDSRPE